MVPTQVFDAGKEIWHSCGNVPPEPVTLEAGKIVLKITTGPESVPGQAHSFSASYIGLTGSLGFTIAIVGLCVMLFVVTVPLCAFCYLHRGDATVPIVRHFSKHRMSNGSNRIRVNQGSTATLASVHETSPHRQRGTAVAPAASLGVQPAADTTPGTSSWGARAISVGVGGTTPQPSHDGGAGTTATEGQLFVRAAPVHTTRVTHT